MPVVLDLSRFRAAAALCLSDHSFEGDRAIGVENCRISRLELPVTFFDRHLLRKKLTAQIGPHISETLPKLRPSAAKSYSRFARLDQSLKSKIPQINRKTGFPDACMHAGFSALPMNPLQLVFPCHQRTGHRE